MTGTNEQKRVVRTADHRSHYIIGGIPTITADDIRIHVYNEIVTSAGGDYHISNAQLIMTRSSAQRLLDSLKSALSTEEAEPPAEVIAVPQDVAMGIERGSDAHKKKVQKIRLK
jgi:hypothetical protein